MNDHSVALTRVLGGACEKISQHVFEARSSYLRLLINLGYGGEHEFIWDEVVAIKSAVLAAESAIETIRLICPANLDLEKDGRVLAEKLAIASFSAHAAASSWVEKRPDCPGKAIRFAFSVTERLGDARDLAEEAIRFLSSIPKKDKE